MKSDASAPPPPDSHQGPSLASVRDSIAQIVETLIGASESVELDAPLLDSGLDSLGATELVRQISEMYVPLASTVVFEHSSVVTLAKHVHQELNKVKFSTSGQQLKSTKIAPAQVESQWPGSESSDDDTNIDENEGFDPASREASVCISGVACLFPGGSAGPNAFWQHVSHARSASSKVPFDRWDCDAMAAWMPSMPDPVKRASSYGAFVQQGLQHFDCERYGISPAEAAAMDPQQRVVLDMVRLALLDAGFDPDSLRGSNTGVYLAITQAMAPQKADAGGAAFDQVPSVYAANSASVSSAAGRVSFVFDFHGPCAAYDTACSSSLVATEAAYRDIAGGRCDVAVVAAVNLLLNPQGNIVTANAGMLSPTGASF